MTMMSARSVPAATPKLEYAIAIHGGAGIDPAKLTGAQRQRCLDGMGHALDVGQKILADGGQALDAVEATIRVLEDDPQFNAGRGAVFNSQGKHELDASIMDGKSGMAGAVAGVTTVKNPISLARLVMTETRHVLLAGEGAEHFADEMKSKPQIERVPNSYFDTDERRAEWLKAVDRQRKREAESGNAAKPAPDSAPRNDRSTVGCVALDKHGNLAAGTSTGGVTNKKWGRVGDTPIIGAGCFADNATCAVSCTGTGEYFIRHSIAFHVSALMAYKNDTLDAAAHELIDKVLPADTGGLIAVDSAGHIAMPFSTAGMSRACADSSGRREIAIGNSDRHR